jgi:hypothetical protein
MTREPAKNPAASIRARLLALAQSRGQDYQRVLGRYAIERFLFRLGNSTYRDRFAVKGATLFTLWTGDTHPAYEGLGPPRMGIVGHSWSRGDNSGHLHGRRE